MKFAVKNIFSFLRRLADQDTPEQRALVQDLRNSLIKDLSTEAKVIDEYEVRRLYSRDLAEIPRIVEKLLFKTTPLLVLQPGEVEDIVKILEFANRHSLPVFPRGVASWGFGGATPTTSGIVIDTSVLNRILNIDSENMTVTVEPGARWGILDQFLQKRGYSLIVYPSNRFSTVGGWISTGGYGVNSFKYGHLKNWTEAIQVVTPSGQIVTFNSTDENFALLFGSEGQLGIITKVILKIRKKTPHSYTHLFYCEQSASAFQFVEALIENRCFPAHVRFMDRFLMRQLNKVWQKRTGRTLDSVVEEKHALLLQFDDPADEKKFSSLNARPEDLEEAPQHVANYLWLERFSPLKVQILGPSLLASELLLPIHRTAEFIEKAKRLAKRLKVNLLIETHFIKANERYEILTMPMFNCDRRKHFQYFIYTSLASMLTRLGIKCDGSPYGIGIWNVPLVSKSSLRMISAVLQYKRTIDPNEIMNPGKYWRVRSRFFDIPAQVFRPLFFNSLLDILIFLSSAIGWFLSSPKEVQKGDFLEICTLECTSCGNCIAVCPAYAVTKDESVVPRSKLRLARKVIQGKTVSQAESDRAFLCTRCGTCEKICQGDIPLLKAWEELERLLLTKYQRPEQKIKDFIECLGTNKAYLELIESEPY